MGKSKSEFLLPKETVSERVRGVDKGYNQQDNDDVLNDGDELRRKMDSAYKKYVSAAEKYVKYRASQDEVMCETKVVLDIALSRHIYDSLIVLMRHYRSSRRVTGNKKFPTTIDEFIWDALTLNPIHAENLRKLLKDEAPKCRTPFM